jgi:hypothetical protein
LQHPLGYLQVPVGSTSVFFSSMFRVQWAQAFPQDSPGFWPNPAATIESVPEGQLPGAAAEALSS